MPNYSGNPYLPFIWANAENISKAIVKDNLQSLDPAKDKDLRILFDAFIKAVSQNSGKVSGITLAPLKGVSFENVRSFAEALVISKLADEMQVLGDSIYLK